MLELNIQMFIPIILGTAREGRRSERVARLVLEEAEAAEFETELIDVREIAVEATGKEHPRLFEFSAKIARADGLVIVAPEYNHGYPGELKIFLDSMYDEYELKPLGICSVSSGEVGGARMVEALRLVALELGLVPIRSAVHFRSVNDLFDETGALIDSSYRERVRGMLDELSRLAEIFSRARA